MLKLAQDVDGIPTRDYPTPAARPLNSRLSLNKLEQAMNIQLPNWQQSLDLTVKECI
jgi:dTDP-4-dehydrorhamnose reductase